MPVLFPAASELEWRRTVEALLRQHHVDLQRLWGRQPAAGTLVPGMLAPIDPTQPPPLELAVGRKGRRVRGLLAAPLLAPVDPLTEPATAAFTVLARNPVSEQLEATAEVLILTNYDPSLSAPAGSYIKAEELEGVFCPYWVSCPPVEESNDDSEPPDTQCDGAEATWAWTFSGGGAWYLTAPCPAGCQTNYPTFHGGSEGETQNTYCTGEPTTGGDDPSDPDPEPDPAPEPDPEPEPSPEPAP